MLRIFLLLLTLALCACQSENETPKPEETGLYFPPVGTSTWETQGLETLAWDTQQLDSLYQYLEANGTRGFIILKEGKIVVEQYWGQNIAESRPFTSSTLWYWASAGKSLIAFLTGVAQEQGLLDISQKSSDFLGTGWTSLSAEKEALITVRHQLTMSTGLEYEIPDVNCLDPACLQYRADAGTQWYYHNAPYTLLKNVIETASSKNINEFTEQNLGTKIGMTGTWIFNGSNNTFWTTPRDMARFGLLVLNRGKWNDEVILEDQNYFNDMLNTSQSINPSYGYLWWLNGKGSVIPPGTAKPWNFSLAPAAPADLVLAAGKNGQFIDVVPSKGLVLVRMGQSPTDALVPIIFHNEIWKRLNLVMGE